MQTWPKATHQWPTLATRCSLLWCAPEDVLQGSPVKCRRLMMAICNDNDLKTSGTLCHTYFPFLIAWHLIHLGDHTSQIHLKKEGTSLINGVDRYLRSTPPWASRSLALWFLGCLGCTLWGSTLWSLPHGTSAAHDAPKNLFLGWFRNLPFYCQILCYSLWLRLWWIDGFVDWCVDRFTAQKLMQLWKWIFGPSSLLPT